MNPLLADRVARFNAGVRTGEWGPMLELFAEDGELAFEGVPVGPFVGRAAIAAAYRERPPGGEFLVLDEGTRDGLLVSGHAWAAEPERRAGELRLAIRDGRIGRLVVTFGRAGGGAARAARRPAAC